MIIKGKMKWVKVNSKLDTFDGEDKGYSVDLYLPTDKLKALKDLSKKMLDETKADPEWKNMKNKKPTKWDGADKTPFKVDQDGNEYVVFKTKHTKLDSEGNEERKYVPVFDKTDGKSGKQLFDDYENIKIGNESEGFVSFSPSVYWNNSAMHGIKFYLSALQLTKFVPMSSGTAEGFGFETIDGDDSFPDDDPEI